MNLVEYIHQPATSHGEGVASMTVGVPGCVVGYINIANEGHVTFVEVPSSNELPI